MMIPKIGKAMTLTPEQWQEYIDEIKMAAPMIANMFLKINRDGRGQEDHDDYLNSQLVAVCAMEYVKQFCSDKVVFATVKEEGKIQ